MPGRKPAFEIYLFNSFPAIPRHISIMLQFIRKRNGKLFSQINLFSLGNCASLMNLHRVFKSIEGFSSNYNASVLNDSDETKSITLSNDEHSPKNAEENAKLKRTEKRNELFRNKIIRTILPIKSTFYGHGIFILIIFRKVLLNFISKTQLFYCGVLSSLLFPFHRSSFLDSTFRFSRLSRCRFASTFHRML